QVDKVHTISDGLLAVARKEGLPERAPVEKITPAIDIRQFSSNGRKRNMHNPIHLLTVARLRWVKGLEYTLEALAILHRKGFDFRYTIIGEGSEYERLCFAAHQLGISDRVHFVGKLPHEAVKKAMEGADIYLQYSVQEGFCNAVLEAQAMGLLCIVSDAEGLPENVLHDVTGWVVPKRRPELLAQQIDAVLQMPAAEHERIRKQAVERVKREFNLEKQQQEFLDFYSR
ncbi:MAG: glycosyltransferase, partial [Bacteroidetes bacterium]